VKVSGVVIADCVVRKDGSVGDVKIVRSLDAATDQATVAALRQWRFTPAQRAGKPVSVQMLISMNFTP
jgi:TonB family protein